MRNTWLIIQREYLQRVRTRTFFSSYDPRAGHCDCLDDFAHEVRDDERRA